jgi:DNA-binding response OmpR family regulator
MSAVPEKKLLIVDDDVHIRRLVRIYLRDSGFTVEEAATGEDAIDLSAKTPFDVVLVDLILPYYGGFRVCQKIKALPAPPRVIVISGDDSAGTRDMAVEYRADGFVAKPFTRDELVAAVTG